MFSWWCWNCLYWYSYAPPGRRPADSQAESPLGSIELMKYENKIEVVNARQLGGTAYIPFKVNSQVDCPARWERMFHYFNFRREEFLQHYHKRSNIESTFSMTNAKFRDHVRATTDTAMKNEVLAKVICHNICCVISSWYELGIEPGFWAGKEFAS